MFLLLLLKSAFLKFVFITFLPPLCAGYSYSSRFLSEMAETSDNEVNNFEYVYCSHAATTQNDSQISEPVFRQAPFLTERVI